MCPLKVVGSGADFLGMDYDCRIKVVLSICYECMGLYVNCPYGSVAYYLD